MGNCVDKLTDSELLEALDSLAREHRELVAKIVEHLAEVERRRLHLELGYSSLYVYATDRLGLSEHEAYLRIRAARVASKHDEVISHLESGALSLTSVKAVAPHLEAHPELLSEAAGKSKSQVERLVAETVGIDSVQSQRGLRQRPIAGGRVELTCVVSEETAELFEEALDLMMHDNPERDCDRALARALRLLVKEKKKPRGSVPASAERQVEGAGRCSFVGTGGRVCGEPGFVQLDHFVPKADGGTDAPNNLRWLCGPHNRYEAERKLGVERVNRQRERAELEREKAKLEREVSGALTNLGFAKPQAAKAARRAMQEAPSLDLAEVIRAALAGMPLAGVVHAPAKTG